jgi:hypothetical protein
MRTRHRPTGLIPISLKLLSALAFVVLLAAPARAQTAQISGHISDTSNAAIPGAVVTITNLATGVMRTGTANTEGLYTVPLLPPGQYRVEVQLDGFAPMTRSGVTLGSK